MKIRRKIRENATTIVVILNSVIAGRGAVAGRDAVGLNIVVALSVG